MMKSILNFLIIAVILSLVIGNAFASNVSNSSNASNVSSISTSIASSSPANYSINSTSTIMAFKTAVSPFTPYITAFVLILFVIMIFYGISIIYSKTFGGEIEAEKRMHLAIQFILVASLVLLIIPFIYLYITYFPQIIQITASNLISIHSSVPFYILYTDLFISVIVSLVGFLLAMREYFSYIKSFQSTGNEDESSHRSMILQRFIGLSAFMYLSPIVIGILFIFITQIFFSISVSMATSVSTGATASGITFPFYQTNLYPHCPTGLGVINVEGDISCQSYQFANTIYGVGVEGMIFNSIVKVMDSPFGSISLFMILYSVGILLLMIYSFAKIDWYSLQYMASLKTGEMEAKNYNKLKDSYTQYIAFLFSPIVFVIAIFVLTAISTAILSVISNSSMSFVPPLINLAGTPTSENILLSASGLIMSFFGLLLFIAVILFSMLKWIGALLFMFGIFLYFSDDARRKMFGKRLLEIFAILFLIPVIIIIVYSIWFGFIPSFLSQIFGYGGSGVVTTSLGSYYSSYVSNSSTSIMIHGSGANFIASCTNRSNLTTAIGKLSSLSDNGDALGVLLGSCQNFVGYWSNGYEMIALASIVLLILGIIGFGTIASFVGGSIGIGGTPDAVKITSGIKGKPMKEKLSIISSNIENNKKTFAAKMKKMKKDGIIGKEITGRIKGNINRIGSKALSVSSKAENVSYGYATSPIVATGLGNFLDKARSSTKSAIKGSISGYKSDVSLGGSTYISNKEFDNYAKENKRSGEKISTAKKRLKKEFEDKYNASFDKYGNVKMSVKEYGKLARDTGRNFKNSNLFNANIEKAKENRNDEISSINSEFEKKIKNAKSKDEIDSLEKERDNEIKKVDKKYDFSKIARNEGFGSYKQYETMKKFADDSVAVLDEKAYISSRIEEEREKMKENISKELNTDDKEKINIELKKRFDPKMAISNAKNEIEAKRSNIISILKDNGADESKIERIMNKTPHEFTSMISLAFDNMEKTKSLDKSFEVISNAINNSDVTLPFKIKTAIGNVGKETKLNFANPIMSDIYSRAKSTADFIGKMKDYYLVSGVSVADKYNDEMENIEERMSLVGRDSSKYKEIMLNSSTTSEEKRNAEAKLESLIKEYNELDKSKKSIESKIDFIKTNPIMKQLMNKNATPTMAIITKLANGDEIGRIELSKKMLENELRIMGKNIESYENDLKIGREMMSQKDLTDYQKLQIENEMKELEFKIKDTSNSKKLLENSSNDMKDMLERMKDVSKIKDRISEIYVNSTLLKKTNEALNRMIQRDRIMKEIVEGIEKPKEMNEELNEMDSFKSTLEKFTNELNDKIEKRDIHSINTEEISGLDTERLSKMLESDEAKLKMNEIEKYTDIIKKINNNETAKAIDIYKNSNEIAELRSDVSARISNAIDSAIMTLTNDEEKKSLEAMKSKIKEDDIFNTEKIDALAEKDSVLKKAIEDSKLKDMFDNIAYFTEVSAMSFANENIKKTKEEISRIIDEKKIDVEERIDDIKSKMISKYGNEEPKKEYFERMLCDESVKKIFNETEKSRFDYKIFSDSIRKTLENVKDRYGLTNDEVKMISNFDASIFNNEKWKTDYETIMDEIIMPKIKEMKHNSISDYIKMMGKTIDNGNLTIKIDDSLNELDSIETATITTALALNMKKFENKMKEKKPTKTGMRLARFKHFKLQKISDDYYGD